MFGIFTAFLRIRLKKSSKKGQRHRRDGRSAAHTRPAAFVVVCDPGANAKHPAVSYTVRDLRPLARRRRMTLRPLGVFIL